MTAVLILMISQAAGASGDPCGRLLPRMLHPAYQDLVPRPAEMYGFWLWTGPDSIREQMERTGANASSMHLMMQVEQAEDTPHGVRVSPSPVVDAGLDALAGAGVGLGEHNNPFFVRYPDWFWRLRQEARMKDRAGRNILVGANRVPAMLDPLLARLAKEQMTYMIGLLGRKRWVRYWVIGGEQSWPDYFGLPEGDHSPAVTRHFTAWRMRTGRTDWREFRDSVVVDRYAGYTPQIHSLDPTRPAMVPTHGNPFAFDFRSKLGYPLGDLAGVSDGFEAGPISIDDDAERIIRMTLDQQTSFGLPVVAPRLANKQLDPAAKGGGRTFTPPALRRAVYEALGLGVWHIGLVHWRGDLPDGEWGIAGTPAESEARRVFDELRRAAPHLDGCSRLQPRVGIFISDAAWRSRWQDRWTLLYDEAIKRGWSVVLLTDAEIDAQLAKVTPFLLSTDNSLLSEEACRRLGEYTRAGGKIILPRDSGGPPVSVIHQTQTTSGANTWPVKVEPLDLDAVEAVVGEGLRPVTVIEEGVHAEGIEPLLLTDGTNVQVVLINRTDERRSVQLSSDNLGPVGRDGRARDLLTGEPLLGGITIEPLGTALFSIEPPLGAERAKYEVERAESAIALWTRLGADTKRFGAVLDRAREHLGGGRWSKACALSRSITHSLALRSSVEGLRVEVRAWDADGRPVEKAQVRLRLVPGLFAWLGLKEISPGIYRLDLARNALPVFYNPSTEKYELADGATEIIVDASIEDLRGGARVFISLNGR